MPTCTYHQGGHHRLVYCDDPQCCPRGYVEVCRCGERLGNEGRRQRKQKAGS